MKNTKKKQAIRSDKGCIVTPDSLEDLSTMSFSDSVVIGVYQPPVGYFNAHGLSWATDSTPSRVHRFFARLLLGWNWEPAVKEHSGIAGLVKKDETQS